MIVCSCNVLSDKQIATVLQGDPHPPRISQVYACLGCRAQCGQCAPTFKRIRDDVLASRLSITP
jgi:bacterioferritin-associated ferredoxin